MDERLGSVRSGLLGLLVVIGVGALALAGAVHAVGLLLPAPDTVAEAAGDSVVVTGPAAPSDAVAQVDRCEVVDGRPEAGGRLRNTSGGPQAFVVHLAYVEEGRVVGTPVEVDVPALADGADRGWEHTLLPGAVSEAPDVTAVDCVIDRVSLGEDLPAGD